MLEPAVPYQAERRCLRGTNVLETTFCTSGGAVHVVDALNRDEDGPLPWTELARDVRGLLRLRDQEIAVVTGQAGKSRARRAEVGGEFTARPGADALLALAAADWGPVPLPRADRVWMRLRATEASWQRWSETVELGAVLAGVAGAAAATVGAIAFLRR